MATKFGGRSGSSGGVGLGDMVSFQVPWLFNLLGLSIIGLVGCAVALRDQRVRPLAAMALASVGVYAVIFRQAAAGHQYWNYWAVFPTAIGWGYLLHLLVGELRRPGETGASRRGPVAVSVIVAGVCLFNLVRPNRAASYIADGQRSADLVADTTFPAGQTSLPYIGQPYRPDAWITYNTGRTPVAVTTDDQLRAWPPSNPTRSCWSWARATPATPRSTSVPRPSPRASRTWPLTTTRPRCCRPPSSSTASSVAATEPALTATPPRSTR